MQHVNMIFVVAWQIWELLFKAYQRRTGNTCRSWNTAKWQLSKEITTTLIDLKLYNHRKLDEIVKFSYRD